ncbi:hypothetical protein Syun_001401 [Stephania yunnanensis]|uniref:Uncharacterized protein n=1 Tax=Stephania yunnanensis TaxID=152371 RepID=A0AAP0LE10_9MAGN
MIRLASPPLLGDRNRLERPTEATFLSALFKRLASANGGRGKAIKSVKLQAKVKKFAGMPQGHLSFLVSRWPNESQSFSKRIVYKHFFSGRTERLNGQFSSRPSIRLFSKNVEPVACHLAAALLCAIHGANVEKTEFEDGYIPCFCFSPLKRSLLTSYGPKDSALLFPLVTSQNLFCASDRFMVECSWSSRSSSEPASKVSG